MVSVSPRRSATISGGERERRMGSEDKDFQDARVFGRVSRRLADMGFTEGSHPALPAKIRAQLPTDTRTFTKAMEDEIVTNLLEDLLSREATPRSPVASGSGIQREHNQMGVPGGWQQMAAGDMDVDTNTPPQQPQQQAPQTRPNPTNPPAPAPNPVQAYVQMAHQRLNTITKDWVPHEFTVAERHAHHQQTLSLISHIQRLTTEKERIAPQIDGRLETQLFLARVDYRITFARLFRINDLPTEIILNIFHYVVWAQPDSASSISARMRLTWVTSRWRRIALDDATLWNVIWWNDRPSFTRSKAFMERSRDAPKDIRIDDTSDAQPMTVDTLRTLMGRIMPRIASIRVLIVILREWDSVLFIVDQLRAVQFVETPMMLNRLELHRNGSPYVQLGRGYKGPYREAMPLLGGRWIPSLRHLSVSGIQLDWARSPIQNLTILDFRKIALNRAPSFQQFRSILSTSPNMAKLILDGAGPHFNGRDLHTIDFNAITLPNLRSVALADFSCPYIIYVFSQFHAPNLRDLTVLNLQGEDYSPFFQLMIGKMPHLRVLTVFAAKLEDWTLPDGTIVTAAKIRHSVVRWLESMPNITFLRFGTLHESFLDCFVADPREIDEQHRFHPEHAVILPSLRILEWQRMEPRPVIDFANRRKALGVALHKMYLNQATADLIHTNRDIATELRATLDPPGNIFLLRPGHKAPEESSLQRV
ncbi:hypothetical protein NMY22_g18117 [Coprinellus aureogranulatus]|nr:hypothetical protein NMY22_g18117 [Coprinellus aureogranulatus]